MLIKRPPQDWLKLARLVFTLFAANSCLRLCSFRLILAQLNRAPKPTLNRPTAETAQSIQQLAARIEHIDNRLRWLWRPSCLRQALAVGWLIKRRGVQPEIKIGVATHEDGQLKAHAWLELAEPYCLRLFYDPTYTPLASY